MRGFHRNGIGHIVVKGALLFFLSFLLFSSCQPEFKKYEPPEWIEGKLFRQLQSIPETDSFEVCLVRTGFDTILNKNNYSVFAPDNKAFVDFFAVRPQYQSVYDIPKNEVLALVKRHVIQNPWSRDQLQRANEYGWINRRDPENDKPWSFKRQTLLKEENRKYWIRRDNKREFRIVDSTESTEFLTVYQPSRKYVPIFFDEHMDLAGVSSTDFEFYFDRPYEPGGIYYGGARLSSVDYFAENGFIFVLDRMVPPLKNVEQLLESTEKGYYYSMFRDLIYLFPEFQSNEYRTNLQEGVDHGIEVQTLYDLDYDELVFDIHEEFTGNPLSDEKTTTRYHHGILAPTNEALQDLIDEVITVQSGDSTRWPTFELVPKHIKKIIVNAHMSKAPIHLSGLEHGFINGLWDSVIVDPASVIEKDYGSNATFIGLSKAVVPRAFSSITAPVYLRPQYIGFMKGLEYSGLAPALKRRHVKYSFYVVQVDEDYFDSWDTTAIVNLLVDQVGISTPQEKARKEFIPTLGGNFIVYDTTRRPRQFEEPTDNGKTFAASGFNRPRPANVYWIMKNKFPAFFKLMEDAGMTDRVWGKLKPLKESEFHTVLAPTDEALSKYNTDTLSTEELQQFIEYHCIFGDIIFTDGNKSFGVYETLRKDESSTPYNTRFTTLDIRPEPGLLRVYDNAGNHICNIPETRNKTNLMFGKRRPIAQTTGVVHAIDTVLLRHQP